MKEKEGRRVVAMKTFELVEKKSQDLNAKLLEAERDKKSAEVTLDRVESRQRLSASCSTKLRTTLLLPGARSRF